VRTFLVLISLIGVLGWSPPSQANNFVKELTHSLERGLDGGTRFTLHLSNGETVLLSGADYQSFRFYYRDSAREVPSVIELYSGSGKKKHNIMINLYATTYYRLDIEKTGGKWVYDFHFYF
jgi:hypothetical protein